MAAVLLLLLGAPRLVAWEYPSDSLEAAAARGAACFLGRVLGVEEVKRTRGQMISIAKVRVLECFRGPGCRPGQTVHVRHLTESFLEPVDDGFGMPTALPVSSDLLFVFASQPRVERRMTFNFDVHAQGVDVAFEMLADGTDETEWQAGHERRFANIYARHRSEIVTRTELHRLIDREPVRARPSEPAAP